jgi:transcriptional regulator with XRE-family HTH domain
VPRRGKADETSQRFGQAVKAARNARGETLETVAGRIDRMDAKYLGEIERGFHSPSISTAVRVARGLELELAELVHGL